MLRTCLSLLDSNVCGYGHLDSRLSMKTFPRRSGRARNGWVLPIHAAFALTQSMAQTPDTLNPAVNSTVYSVVQQTDGSTIAAGNFTMFAAASFQSAGRLNPGGGASDPMFNRTTTTAYANNPILCVAVQPDGKLVVGGGFTNLTGVPRSRLTRLTSDGRLDITFNASANTNVHALIVQPDGKILVAGAFTNLSGQARAYLGRIEANGALDTNFVPQLDGPVYTLAVETNGTLLIGGSFTNVNGTPRARIARLDTDGNLDGFDPGADGNVLCLAVQPDGQILAGGNFTTFDGQPRQSLARVGSNGLLDAGFNPQVAGEVRTLALQTDGRISLGGLFNSVGGQNRTNVARLDASGGVDAFDPGPNGAVMGLSLQPDGKLYMAGDFTFVGGVARQRMARLSNDVAAAQSLTLVGTTITWLRSGSSPEVQRVTFAASTNGSDWFDLAPPQRISGGWQLTGVMFPSQPSIRARGEVSGGYNNGSTWITESSTGRAAISMQASDQTVPLGATARFSITPAGNGPISCQWYRNGAAIPGATSPWYTRSDVAGSTYDVAVSNTLGTARSRVATLFVPGPDALDGDLANTVYGLALQPDGTIVTGGGVSILRFNPDGALDYSFTPTINTTVNCLHALPDGKMLAAGAFTSVAGLTRNRLVRFNAGGDVDLTFNPNAGGLVNTLAVQPDGKILVGGSFLTLGGVAHTNVARLNANGTPDATFTAGTDGAVLALALQPDGKILVGGTFTRMNGVLRARIARLNEDGSLDMSFDPGMTGSAPGTGVYCLTPQPDGKIVVGGSFTLLAGQSRASIGRLNDNGSIDSTFNPGVNGPVQSLILQADGRILVGGTFSVLGGQNRANLGRLNPDGTLDTLFSPSTSGAIFSLALQGDGKIVAGGSFTTLWGASRSRLGRLSNTTAAIQSLTTDGSTITWTRGGSTPEILRASFDYCTNSVDWIPLPAPERIAGGWQAVGATVPPGATLRARGQVAAGYLGGSGYLVESSTGPTAISIQPVGRTGTSGYVRVSVTMAGPGPFTYQWYRDGVALPNATNSWYLASILPTVNAYEVVIVGPGGTWRSQPAFVWLYGTDLTFNPGADGPVYALAVQPDLKILVGGAFTNSPGTGLARVNATGSTRDSNFVASALGGAVTALAIQRDGQILVGGSFTNLAGAPRSCLGRVNTDGSIDAGFNPVVSGYAPSVHCLALQPDGKILVAGNFSVVAGQSRYCVARLHENGSLDTDFNPPSAPPPTIEVGATSILLQPDGSVIVCGELKEGVPNWTTYVERLDANGSLLARLMSATAPVPAVHYIECAVAQADGGVLVGGYFDWIDTNSQLHRNVLRFDPFGQVDPTFTAGANSPVSALALQADGKLLVGGVFTSLAGASRNSLGRLNPDGSMDNGFDLQATGSSWVRSLAIQSDGRVLVGGSFTNLATRTRNNLGRLSNSEIGASRVQLAGADVNWQRGNVNPDIQSAILEASSDGLNWTPLGDGSRVGMDWQWTGVSIPTDALLRTRGFIGGNNTFWLVEDLLATAPRTPPTILASSGSLGVYSNRFGLHVSGSLGHLAVVEASTNLVNWTRLQTNRLYSTPVLYSDAVWTNYPNRFYRAFLP